MKPLKLILAAGIIGGLIASAQAGALKSDELPRGSAQPQKSEGLVELAEQRFPNLTRAERAMLAYADVGNLDRGRFAVCGTSADPADPSNDPKDAAKWSHDRDIRASLIRWLAVDRAAAERVDPKGLRVLGARVTGALDLSQVRVPFPITLNMCSFAEAMNLDNADIPRIEFAGSYTAEIHAWNLNVRGFLNFGALEPGHVGAFHASGAVDLIEAKAEGFYFGGGHFHFSEKAAFSFGEDPAVKMALLLNEVESRGDVIMCCGFESQGAVMIPGLKITNAAGDLNCSGGRFINPNNIALFADSANIAGGVLLEPQGLGYGSGGFYADGLVDFSGTHTANGFVVQNSRFAGKSTEQHGFIAQSSVTNLLIWRNVTMDDGAKLDLSGASIRYVLISKNSLPTRGNLIIDGLTYSALSQAPGEPPWEEPDYLRFLRLQPPGLHP